MQEIDQEQAINEAVAYVRSRAPRDWRVMIVLGSGLGPLADEVQNPVYVPYSEIPHFAHSTVPGHSGRFVIGDLLGVPVGVMQGRVHYYEGHPMWQVGLPVRVGGLVVDPGDLLHGDANGVTNIPLDIATEVADISQEFVDAEKIVLDYVNGTGKKTPAGLTAARKEYSAVVAKLTARAKK